MPQLPCCLYRVGIDIEADHLAGTGAPGRQRMQAAAAADVQENFAGQIGELEKSEQVLLGDVDTLLVEMGIDELGPVLAESIANRGGLLCHGGTSVSQVLAPNHVGLTP